ncbi:cupin domain-containing protein [Reichenbachiella ulvae]|uniref:Cupin domain-containing protein n=1 Tax=Reichenbachiella ulvae TaxID=2980104 RepID=A0ABT3CZ17_9BACT|nr:cupin domain-containing protein [Reichenbachiella ulvae]MCV9388867.1 cupin domain-containing protein [Reichenbachiella ulvae]
MTEKIKALIEKLELAPHPEGGYFRETYRSTGTVDLGAPFYGERNHSTCIYFLLTGDSFSAFHRINQDEAWHFYQGDPIELHMIHPDGTHEKIIIGNEIEQGMLPQYVVPAGSWFAAKTVGSEGYALVGCTVSPGFEFADFELAKRQELTEKFTLHAELITEFTRI